MARCSAASGRGVLRGWRGACVRPVALTGSAAKQIVEGRSRVAESVGGGEEGLGHLPTPGSGVCTAALRDVTHTVCTLLAKCDVATTHATLAHVPKPSASNPGHCRRLRPSDGWCGPGARCRGLFLPAPTTLQLPVKLGGLPDSDLARGPRQQIGASTHAPHLSCIQSRHLYHFHPSFPAAEQQQ